MNVLRLWPIDHLRTGRVEWLGERRVTMSSSTAATSPSSAATRTCSRR